MRFSLVVSKFYLLNFYNKYVFLCSFRGLLRWCCLAQSVFWTGYERWWSAFYASRPFFFAFAATVFVWIYTTYLFISFGIIFYFRHFAVFLFRFSTFVVQYFWERVHLRVSRNCVQLTCLTSLRVRYPWTKTELRRGNGLSGGWKRM